MSHTTPFNKIDEIIDESYPRFEERRKTNPDLLAGHQKFWWRLAIVVVLCILCFGGYTVYKIHTYESANEES